MKGGLEHIEAAGRGKKFWCFHHLFIL
jgi:hypothetical protein